MKITNKIMGRLSVLMALVMIVCSMAAAVPADKAEAAAAGSSDLMEAAVGYSTDISIKPGAGLKVSIKLNPVLVDTYTSHAFSGFYLSSDTELLACSSPVLYDSAKNAEYPFTNPTQYSQVGIANPETEATNDEHTVEFNLGADYSLPKGDYEIVLYGIEHVYSTSKDAPRTFRIATFTVTNTVDPGTVTFDVDVSYDSAKMVPGSDTYLNVTLKNDSMQDSYDTYMILNYNSSIQANYTMERISIGTVKAGATVTQKVPVSVLSTAEAGKATVTVHVYGCNKAGESCTDPGASAYVTIGEKPKDSKDQYYPNLVITTEDNYKTLKAGSSDTITLTLDNSTGTRQAKDIVITVEGLGTASGITKGYLTDTLTYDTILRGESAKISVPIVVTDDADTVNAGLHEISFTATYKDIYDKTYTTPVMTMYVEIPAKETAKDTTYNYINIRNVVQSPESPVAGETVTVSFDVVNNGNAAITNVQVYGDNLSSHGFEPINSDPYTTVGTIAAGDSARVTMKFKVGEDISKGMNALEIGVSYINRDETKASDSATLYILNVVAKADAVDTGRPKLIISSYSTDKDILKAADTFDFSFTLHNTHASKAARNIKVTISQSEGVFAAASGTNIFYIESIEPGQEATETISLKTKADVSTGDYDLTIQVEYEYENMSDVDKEKGGVSDTNEVKLHATENYRPVIENVYIDSWETIYVGTAVDLSLEFYNMGKSTLGNVYVTVEGDFELANNSNMSYVGAVNGYGQEYINPSVVPLVSGDAVGTVVVHFEDSNGDEQTISKEFTAYVEDNSSSGEIDWSDFNWDDTGYDDYSDTTDDSSSSFLNRLASLPVWIYAAAGAVIIAVIVIIVVNKSKKKSSKKKQETDADDEDF